jgi:hypothetical protein
MFYAINQPNELITFGNFMLIGLSVLAVFTSYNTLDKVLVIRLNENLFDS